MTLEQYLGNQKTKLLTSKKSLYSPIPSVPSGMHSDSNDVFSGLVGEFVISPNDSKENSYTNLLKQADRTVQSKSIIDKNKQQFKMYEPN